jgi:predicted alpha/beta-fold hydrolase
MLFEAGIVVILVVAAVLLRHTQTQPHREYVTLAHVARAIHALVLTPKFGGKTPVVVLVHEVYGLTGPLGAPLRVAAGKAEVAFKW